MTKPIAIIGGMTGGLDRILEVEITDHAGNETDTLKITLDDRDWSIQAPPTGTELSCSMGYEDAGVSDMGTYIVNSVEVEGEGETGFKMIVEAKSADQKKTQKQGRTTTYQNKTLGDILGAAAKRNGLQANVDPQLGQFKYPYHHQNEESDWNMMTRLAKDHDAVASVKKGKLNFTPRAGGSSGGGDDMVTVVISSIKQLLKYNARVNDRSKHKDSNAANHDHKSGKVQKQQSEGGGGNGTASHWNRHTRPTKEEAKKVATSKQNENTRNEGEVTLELTGNPAIMASGLVTVSVGRSILDDTWVVETVTHKIVGQQGYTTTIHAKSKDGNKNSAE